jgi:hypothetical protein
LNYIQKCPCCEYTFERLSAIAEDEDIQPTPGDLTICLGCASILMFDEDLNIVNRPTEVRLAILEMMQTQYEEVSRLLEARQFLLREKIK